MITVNSNIVRETISVSGGGARSVTIVSESQLGNQSGTLDTRQYPNITVVQADPSVLTRITDLEESTDGLVSGVEPLQYYILARDN